MVNLRTILLLNKLFWGKWSLLRGKQSVCFASLALKIMPIIPLHVFQTIVGIIFAVKTSRPWWVIKKKKSLLHQGTKYVWDLEKYVLHIGLITYKLSSQNLLSAKTRIELWILYWSWQDADSPFIPACSHSSESKEYLLQSLFSEWTSEFFPHHPPTVCLYSLG